MTKILSKAVRKILLVLIGVTGLISSNQKTVPGKWDTVHRSFRAYCQKIHLKLIQTDKKTADKYMDMEDNLKTKVGMKKLYNKEELDLAKKQIDKAFLEKET